MLLSKSVDGIKVSYEVYKVFFDFDAGILHSTICRYEISESGKVQSYDIQYLLDNKQVKRFRAVKSQERILKRNPDGSAILDDFGNPVYTIEEHDTQEEFFEQTFEFSDLVETQVNSSLKDGVVQLILLSYRDNVLKDNSFVLEKRI